MTPISTISGRPAASASPPPLRLPDAIAATAPQDKEDYDRWYAARRQSFNDKVAGLAAAHPEIKIKTPDDIDAEIAAKAHALKAAADGGVNIGWGGLGRFTGSAAAMMTDPVNAVGLLMGLGPEAAVARAGAAARATLMARLGTAGAEIGATAAREGAINAGMTAAVQPIVMDFNQKLGIPYGGWDAAQAIAEGGAGGAVLGGGLKATGLGLKGVLDHWNAAKSAGKVAEDLDSRDAERALSAALDRQEASPFPPNPAGDAAASAATDKATADILSGRPVDVARIVQEKSELGTAYDRVLSDHAGAADDPLVHIRPEDIEGSIIARGGFKDHGDVEVKGSGWGLAKFIWRHGEGSPKAVAEQVTRDDITRFPEIIRDYDATPVGQQREWVVARSDGQRVVYVDSPLAGREGRHVITVHVLDNPGSKPLSARRTGPDGSSARDVAVPREDTSGVPYDQQPQRQSGPASDSIAPPAAKAKAAPPAPWPDELRPPTGKPETLVDWVKRQGGINDDEGWLAHLGVTNKQRPGLIRSAGIGLDDAALRAHEEGFFPEFSARPDPDTLRVAIKLSSGATTSGFPRSSCGGRRRAGGNSGGLSSAGRPRWTCTSQANSHSATSPQGLIPSE